MVNRLLKPTILSISLLTVMAGAAVSPALGSISQAFPTASPEIIKMILSLPAIMIIIFSFVSGRLASSMSKRYIMIAGIVIYLIGGVGAGFCTTIYQLLMFRAILGVGVGLLMPLSIAIITDFFEGTERARMIGLSPAISLLGGVVASLIGGLLAAANWRYTFGVYIIAIFVLLLIIFVVPELHKQPRINVRDQVRAELPRSLYYLAFGQFMLMLVFYTVPTSLAIFMQNQGVGNAAKAGIALAVVNVFGFIAGLIFSRILELIGKNTVIWAMASMTAGLWLLGLAQHLAFILLAVSILGLGFGILQPLIYLETTRLVPKQSTPMAMSIISSALFLGQFMSPILLGFIGKLVGDTSSRFSFNLLGLVMFIGMCIAIMTLYKSSSQSISPVNSGGLENRHH